MVELFHWMSEWNEFVENEMLKAGNLVEGAICSAEDFGVWGLSKNWQITEEEIEKILTINKTFESFDDIEITISNETYVRYYILLI